MTGMGQAVIEDRLLDVLGHPVGMRRAGAGDLVEQPLGAIGLEVAADLIELLAAVAHHPAGLADIAELGGQFEQTELAPCYLLLRGHVVLRSRLDGVLQLHPNPAGERRGHAGLCPLRFLTVRGPSPAHH
jgi:hypothetical protein